MSKPLRIVTINVRGLCDGKKRKALLRQVQGHCDVVILQETHADTQLARVIPKEFPGQWAFSNKTTRSAGVAIRVFGFGLKMSEEQEHISDDGRLLGKLITVNNEPFYIISAYAPCCDTSISAQTANLALLRRAQNLMVCQRALGHTVMMGGTSTLYVTLISMEKVDNAKYTNPKQTG